MAWAPPEVQSDATAGEWAPPEVKGWAPPEVTPGPNLNFDPSLIKAEPVNQPSMFSSGAMPGVVAPDSPDWAMTQAIAEDPKGAIKAVPNAVFGLAAAPGKLAYETAADVISKVAGQPEYGGNLAAGMNNPAAVKPVDQFIRGAAQTNPNLAVTALLAKSVPEIASMMAVNPSGTAGRILAAGFSADSLRNFHTTIADYNVEADKPASEQDAGRMAEIKASLISSPIFALLAGHGSVKEMGPVIQPGQTIKNLVSDALSGPKITPKPAAPVTYRRPGEGAPTYPEAGTSPTPEPPAAPVPAAPAPVQPYVPASAVTPIGDSRRLQLVQNMAAGRPVAAKDVLPGEESILEPAGYVLQGDAWVRQSAMDQAAPPVGNEPVWTPPEIKTEIPNSKVQTSNVPASMPVEDVAGKLSAIGFNGGDAVAVANGKMTPTDAVRKYFDQGDAVGAFEHLTPGQYDVEFNDMIRRAQLILEGVDEAAPASRPVEPLSVPQAKTPPPETAAVAPTEVQIPNSKFQTSAGDEASATTVIDPSHIPTVEFPLKDLKLSKDVPNFKGGASEETGTVVGQELAGKYERRGTAPIVAWQRLDGRTEVITGRHRFDLAKRTGEKTIPTQLVREADGFSKEMALTFDAEANIRDGQGEVSDYATYFKGTDIPEAEARARGLLSRAKGKAGWSLAKAATDDLYALWRNGKVTEPQAVAIANAAPGNAGAQQIGSKFALQGKSPDFLINVIKASQAEAGHRGENLDLFGNDDAAMKQMAEQADRASQFQNDIAEQIRAVQGAVKRPEVARKMGVDVKDPAAVSAKVDELKGERARWENWPLQPDLVAKVRGIPEAKPAPPATEPTPPEPPPVKLATSKREISAIDKQINELTDKRDSVGLSIPESELLRELEARRGQVDLLNAGTGAEQAIKALREKLALLDEQRIKTQERAWQSRHRREELIAEARQYEIEAGRVRDRIMELQAADQRATRGSEDLFGSPRIEIAGGEIGADAPKAERPPVVDDPHHSVLDAVKFGMQEGVQLIKALAGSFPKIKERLVTAAGLFRYTKDKGGIELKADIFDIITREEKQQLRQDARDYARAMTRDRRQQTAIEEERYQFLLDEMRQRELPLRHSVEALKVIFHEIGHLIDWLPDHILRGRGNFFGHIAALKNYIGRIMPEDPNGVMGGKPNAKEVEAMRAEAKRQMQDEVGPMKEIIRKIIVEEPEWKITGISADDIKNILGETAGRETPELTRWFSEQDRLTKTEVLRKAMRGLVDERLAALGKKVQTGTRTVTKTVVERFGREPTVAEVKQRFAELLASEMRKRNLADYEVVKAEMHGAVAWWRGTATIPDYFKTSPEMYAEAFSMFFNNPAGFAKRAPVTARMIWNYMDRKPEVAKLYDKIQNQIKSGEIYKVRVENLHEMFERDAETSLARGKESRFTSWRDFAENVRYHIDRISGPVFKAAEKTSNKGALRQAWGDYNYRAAEHERYFAQSNRDVGALLVKHNLDWNHDFGEYLYHQRVIKERFNAEGAPLANPLGWDVKDSTARLAEMRQALGEERWAAIEEAGRRFYELHQQFVVDPVRAGSMFTPELAQVLADRTAYATFSASRDLPDTGIERMIESQYGAPMTPHIYRQIGMLGEIKNPGTATMLKGASLISAVARNTMKRELIKALTETESFPGELVRPAEVSWNGQARVPRIVDGPKVGTIVYLQDGKAQAFYVRKVLADSANGSSALENHAASILQRGKGLLKGLFTQQPGFWAFNALRDTTGFWAQMPGMRAPIGWARALPRAIVAARASVKGTPNIYADAALKRRMLISRMEQPGSWSQVSNEWEHRVSGYGFDPAAWNRELGATERALKVWHEWMGWGKAIERVNKMAGMIYLDEFAPPKYRNAPEWQKREWVRGLAGSPDFLERGKSANTIDWVFLFYNPWKEGIRSLVTAARTDPVGTTVKASALMLAPTVLQALAYNGAFGDDLKKRYRSVGLYDLTNYLIPHVSSADAGGNVAILRLPLFEPHRVMHGLVFQMITGQSEGLLNHAGGQLPGLNPMIVTALQWSQYLLGENPLDFRRSANLLTDKQQAARGGAHGRPGEILNAAALGTMAQQTWNNLGGTMLYRFQNLNLEQPPATTVQKVVNAPILSNILGRWYKVTNAGLQDQARLAAMPVAKQEAEFSAATDVMMEKLVNKYWPALAKQAAQQPLTGDDYALLKQPIEWTDSERAMFQDPHFQQFMSTRTSQFQKKFGEIIAGRLNPKLRALGVGNSRAQDIEILKAMGN